MIVDHYDESNKGNAVVTGGKFDADISKYIPTDYVQSADGTVEKLGETNAVAKVGGTYYKTLADAVAAAQDGDTITLLKDAELDLHAQSWQRTSPSTVRASTRSRLPTTLLSAKITTPAAFSTFPARSR